MEKRMKTSKYILLFVLIAMLLTACGPKATGTPIFQGNNPYAPQAGDSDLMHGDITIDSASVSLTKSQPPQVTLNFAYFQPTPCYQLRVEVNGPDAQKRIDISAYAVAEKDKPCTLMALATALQASLNLGSLPSGHYSLWLNGSKVDEFDS
jgi:hypothetical protein